MKKARVSPLESSSSAIWLPAIRFSLTFEYVLANAYAQEGDIVFVSGSLVEGTGNECSDIDVYVITRACRTASDINIARHHRVISKQREIIREQNSAAEVMLVHTILPGSMVKMDVEFKTFDEVDALFRHIHDIYEYAKQNLILLTKRLSDRDEIFVHRLFTGVAVSEPRTFEQVRANIHRDEYLYIAYRWVASDFSTLLDIAGAFRSGDLDRAVEIARENVLVQCSAFVRLNGVTNLRRKWLTTYLDKIRGGLEVKKSLLALMYPLDLTSQHSKRSYVKTSLDFVDKLFEISIPLLQSFPTVPHGAEAIALLSESHPAKAADEPYADWELEYRSRAYIKGLLPTFYRLERSGFVDRVDRGDS